MPDDITRYQQLQTEQAIAQAANSPQAQQWSTFTPWEGSGGGGFMDIMPIDQFAASPLALSPGGQPLTGQALIDKWTEHNTRAQQYQNDPAFRAQWDASHGNGSTLGNLFNLGVGAMIGGGLYSGLTGAGSAAGTAAGTAATNPMGSGFTGTGPAVSSMGGGAGSLGSITAGAGGSALTNADIPATVGNATGQISGTAVASGAGNAIGGGSSAPVGGNTLNPTSGGSDVMDWLIPGASLASGLLSYNSTENAMDEIGRQYDQTREDFAPYREAGVTALNQLTDFQPQDDPIYQAQLAASEKAVNRGMAARGYNNSGNVLNELSNNAITETGRYNNDIWNRYAGLAGVGQAATSTTANAGQNAAGGLANLQMQQGQGINNAVQGGISNYLYNNQYGVNPYARYYS